MEGSKTLNERLYLINNVDKLFFNSKWSQKRFFLNFKDPKLYLDKTTVCYQSTNKEKIDFKKKEKIISFIGKLNTAKGYDTFGKTIIKILNKVEFKDGEKTISIEPSKTSLEIDFEIKFKNQKIGTQRNCVNMYETDLKNIYNSRTFCLYEDIEAIKKKGLAKGGSLENAIVVKENEVLNKDGLRNSKEFVNHKILDCIGDLYLSGHKMVAKIVCSQGGHKLTNELLRKLFSDKDNFSIFELKEKNIPHSFINKVELKSIA